MLEKSEFLIKIQLAVATCKTISYCLHHPWMLASDSTRKPLDYLGLPPEVIEDVGGSLEQEIEAIHRAANDTLTVMIHIEKAWEIYCHAMMTETCSDIT